VSATPGSALVRAFLAAVLGEQPCETTANCVLHVLRVGLDVPSADAAGIIDSASGPLRAEFIRCDAERRRLVAAFGVLDEDETQELARDLIADAETIVSRRSRPYTFGTGETP
jgi:hypothetical protein